MSSLCCQYVFVYLHGYIVQAYGGSLAEKTRTWLGFHEHLGRKSIGNFRLMQSI
jgi:hypothetical protein